MIVVFGSINVDLTFRVDHQPAPGETILCSGYLASAGGKGANQAVAAARAGAEISMIGCVEAITSPTWRSTPCKPPASTPAQF